MDEKSLFEGLNRSELGAGLVTYLKKKQDEAYDARKWGANDSVESAKRTSDILQSIIDRITLQSNLKTKQRNPFE